MTQLVILYAAPNADAAGACVETFADLNPIAIEVGADAGKLTFGRHLPLLLIWSRAAEAAGARTSLEALTAQAPRLVVALLDDVDAPFAGNALIVGPGGAEAEDALRNAIKVVSEKATAAAASPGGAPSWQAESGLVIALACAGLLGAFALAGAVAYNSAPSGDPTMELRSTSEPAAPTPIAASAPAVAPASPAAAPMMAAPAVKTASAVVSSGPRATPKTAAVEAPDVVAPASAAVESAPAEPKTPPAATAPAEAPPAPTPASSEGSASGGGEAS